MRRERFTTSDGQRVAYSVAGRGPAVLMVHGALAETDGPLSDRLASEGFTVIGYDRRGYGDSPPATMPRSMADHARDAAELLAYLQVAAAHLVGQSYGGNVVLQLAHDRPDLARSLTLQEPALPGVLFAVPAIGQAFERVIALQQEGRARDALDFFLTGFVGPDYGDILSSALDDGAVERAAPGMNAVVETDLPALQQWAFGPEQASRIGVPVLSLGGGGSHPMYDEVDRMLAAWFPTRRRRTVPHTGHLMALEQPDVVARVLRDHFTSAS